MSGTPAPAAPSVAATVAVPWLGLVAVLLGTFISTLNGRLSTVGLADVEGAVHAGYDEGSWITTSQTVAQMLVVPVALWAGAVFPPRKVLQYAALSFALISLITPLTDNLNVMLALRFAGGVASGFFVPLTLSYILRNLPPQFWAYGIALYGLNLEFSLNISASLEGWYTDHLSWRWIFWQSVPLSLLMAACLYCGGRAAGPNPNKPPSDVFGLLSFGGGLALIYAALDQGNRLDWLNSGLICGLLLAGALLLIGFVIHDLTIARPLIDLRIALRLPLPFLLLLVGFLRLTILSTSFLIPQFLGTVRGYRAIDTGPTFLWIALPQLLICPWAGFLLRRIDPRTVACTGFILISCACYLVAHNLTPLWGSDQFLVSQLMQAVGQSFALTGIVFFAIQHLRPQDALTFGAMLQTARVMGGEIGQAFVTTFTRVRSQAASNLIGLHVQIGDGQVMARIQAYANATHAAGNAASGLARGAALLGSQVHLQALTEGVIDCFEAIAGLTAVGLLLMVAQKAAPRGPATHRSLFAPEDAKPS